MIKVRLELMFSDMSEDTKAYQNLEQINHLIHRIANMVKKMSQVRRYQAQNYCDGVNILDLDVSSRDS